jgi:hypothetical protein
VNGPSFWWPPFFLGTLGAVGAAREKYSRVKKELKMKEFKRRRIAAMAAAASLGLLGCSGAGGFDPEREGGQLGTATQDLVSTPLSIKIGLRTHTGQYLGASDGSQGYRIDATAVGVGPWEVFTAIPAGVQRSTLYSGDRIHLQTQHGRYLMASDDGGGALTGEATAASTWETFTIEKRSGTGEIIQGDAITLRTNNGVNFVMAQNGGAANVEIGVA